MKMINWPTILKHARRIAWALFLIFLPVTSFPLFPPAIGGSALVRPISFYPLFFLIVLVTLPYLFTRRLSPTLLAFLPFLTVAFISSLFSLFYGIEANLGVSLIERLGRALITLAVGAVIYLTVSLYPRVKKDLHATLRWLYVGLSLALVWGSLQAIYVIHFNNQYFKLINKIQQYISIRRLFNTRVSGLTYEPNWFAQQISFLMLPWLLASVVTNQSVFRWRWRWLTVEWFLLFWAVGVLIFTFSRSGLMITLALVVVTLLFFRPHHIQSPKFLRSWLPGWARITVEVTVGLAVLAGLVFMAGRNNVFFSRLWNYWNQTTKPSLSDYINYVGFGARFIYSQAALNVFQDHPYLGIGLGNYAFYFEEYLPDRPISAMPEVLRLITPYENQDRLVTPKNLYVRLMAETGLAGTVTFLGFSVAILGCAIYLRRSPRLEERFWGTGGLLGIIAFFLAASSYDSFAIPNMWVVFGLITAATFIYFHEQPSPTPSLEGLSNEVP